MKKVNGEGRQASLKQAIALTDEILQLIEDGALDHLGEIEQRRQSLIKQAFADPMGEIDEIKARHLKNLNDQVVTKLTLFKKSVQLQQQKIRLASRAKQAYGSLESGSR